MCINTKVTFILLYNSQHLCLKSMIMKGFAFLLTVGVLLVGCVPAKKYNDLLEKEKLCSSELEKYKTDALNYEAEASTFKAKFEVLEKDVKQLKADTSKMGEDYRTLHRGRIHPQLPLSPSILPSHSPGELCWVIE